VSTRVLLADDHRIFREGLRRVLEEVPEIEVVADAENGLEAVQQAAAVRPDVIIMDVGMALTNGIEATRQIVRKRLGRVVMLSMYDDEETVTQAIRMGARGYLPKSSAGRELVDAIQAVQRGEVFLSETLPASLRERLVGAAAHAGRAGDRLSALTTRQRQVLQLVAEGHTNRDIAVLLNVAVETVKSHRKGLKRVLGIDSVAGLTRFAIQTGLVRQPSRRPGAAPPGGGA
jgi:DNA-binding NarL/FixJ family response regulator